MNQTLPIIGRNALVTVGDAHDVPAKVDTGADSSSLWATNIREDDGRLSFTLFSPDSPYYTGQTITVTDYETVTVANSNGTRLRFVAYLPMDVEGAHFDRVRFTLSDRAHMAYPILLGRYFLKNNYLVDVSRELPTEIHDALYAAKRQRA